MDKQVLRAAIILLLFVPSTATAVVDDRSHVLATGSGSLWPSCPANAVLTVDQIDRQWIATLILDVVSPGFCTDAYFYAFNSAFGGFVFPLEGDWQRGFHGEIGFGEVWIGPYGTGTTISVQMCASCFSGAVWFEGTVTRARDG